MASYKVAVRAALLKLVTFSLLIYSPGSIRSSANRFFRPTFLLGEEAMHSERGRSLLRVMQLLKAWSPGLTPLHIYYAV